MCYRMDFFFYRRNGGDPNSQLRLEQGPSGSISQRSLTWSPLDPSSSEGRRSNDRRNSNLIQGNQTENYQLSRSPNHLVLSLPEDGVSEDLGENVLISRVRRDASSNAGNNTNEPERTPEILPRGPASVPEDSCELQAQLNNRDATPESRSLLPPNEERAVRLDNEFQISPCSVALVDIKKENPSFSLHGNQQTRARIIQNEDSEVIELHSDDSDGGENFSEASTSAASQPAPSYSRQPPTKRPCIRRDFLARRINPSSQQGRRRGPRIPRDDNVDFGGAELPVKCGNVEGILYKEKLKQGIYERSIRSQTGRWLTPMEFEIEGNRERSKNWRQSIRCGGRTLGELIKRGVLQDAPRKKKETPPRPWQRKRKLGNPKTCKVCRKPRKVYPCATCRKFYHKNCHIPPVEDTSSPWHCTFCKRKDQLRCQNTQECHKEAEVLKRKMTPEEQLKCELLLLIIYCYPKSGFFIQKPKQRKTNFPDLREHMWLNKIKTCLNKKEYRLVQHFVEDMRLIFQNHSMFYKRRFKNLGIRVGNRFETTFKRIFSIEDTSKQHPPCSTVLLT